MKLEAYRNCKSRRESISIRSVSESRPDTRLRGGEFRTGGLVEERVFENDRRRGGLGGSERKRVESERERREIGGEGKRV
jgi:hypothetical protein